MENEKLKMAFTHAIMGVSELIDLYVESGQYKIQRSEYSSELHPEYAVKIFGYNIYCEINTYTKTSTIECSLIMSYECKMRLEKEAYAMYEQDEALKAEHERRKAEKVAETAVAEKVAEKVAEPLPF